MTTRTLLCVLAAVGLLVGSGCASEGSTSEPEQAQSEPLVGLFRLTPGTVAGEDVSGSWFRMVQPGGTPESGPYMPNSDSVVPGGTATLLEPGIDGGLRTGGFQSEPNPSFADGNSLANSIMKPTKFFAVEFGVSTNAVDPQTQREVAVPSVVNNDGVLSADLSAWAASWNNQEFNQGAPKPPEREGAQAAGVAEAKQVWDWVAKTWLNQSAVAQGEGPSATGTYDPETHAYTLQWTSLIVGGPFNGFTGVWHLEGVFEPGAEAPAPPPPTAEPGK